MLKMKLSKLSISLFAIFLFSNTFLSATVLDYIVAIVNDDVITHSALQNEVQAFEHRLHQKGETLPPQYLAEMQKRILDSMIFRKIQLQRAAQTGIKIDDNTLNAELQRMAQAEGMDLPKLIKTLEKRGQDYAVYREEARNELIIISLKRRDIVRGISITEREIDNFLANQLKQGATPSQYHLLHILIATPESASPEEIAEKKQEAMAVLQKLKAGADFRQMAMTTSDSEQAFEGGDLGWRDIGSMPNLFVDALVKMQVGDIVDEPIYSASGFHIIKLVDKRGVKKSLVMQTKMRHILISTNQIVSDTEAKNKLSDLRLRIQAGENFAELARSHSEDHAAPVDLNELEWSNAGDFVPEFEESIATIPEGQISEPFKTRYGWHIVQVVERRKFDNTEEALRTQALQQIKQRKIEEETQNWLRRLRSQAYVEYRLEGMRE